MQSSERLHDHINRCYKIVPLFQALCLYFDICLATNTPLHAHLMECYTTKTCCSNFSVVLMQVRVARQDRFHEARMKRAAKQQNRADQKELETGIDLIEAPVARLHREQQAQAETEVQPMAVEQAEPVKEKVQAKEKASKQKLRIPVEKPKKRVTAMES